ncbi:MAG: PKD domain-containing protein [Verrucomicrobiota bacterium]
MRWPKLVLLLNLAWFAVHGFADCSLTNIGIVPLPDRGFAKYQDFDGGLYADFSNQPPADHFAGGLRIAANEIQPLNSRGEVDMAGGKIVLMSIGMSNTTQEWASKGVLNFRALAVPDPSRNPQVVIVDGAQGGQDATRWTNVTADTWNNIGPRLSGAGVTSNQVQVLWLKQALARPSQYGSFPGHAQALQNALEQIVRAAQSRYRNLKMVFVSPRTRAFRDDADALNPEPFAFESGFAVKWMIDKQIRGDATLNFDSLKGNVVAPFLIWGPYLWADGNAGRSDGFVWDCNDLEADFTHPSGNGGVPKVARQLVAFFKTHPMAIPWFLKTNVVGQPPDVSITADVVQGYAPLVVRFSLEASDTDGAIRDFQWTFDDGTFATTSNPTKIFNTPGDYTVRLTVTDNLGNHVMRSIVIHVAATGIGSPMLENNRFQFEVQGPVELDLIVERSFDLRNWIPVQTNRGPFRFEEKEEQQAGAFYRAVALP